MVTTHAPLHAQSTSDPDFDAWQRSQSADYEDYRQEEASSFQDYLDREWKDYTLNAGEKQETTPKPRTLPKAPVSGSPTAPPRPTPGAADKPVVVTPSPPPASTPAPTPTPTPKAAPPSSSSAMLRIDYFGRTVTFTKPAGFAVTFTGTPSGPRLAAFWKDMEAAPSREYLKQLQSQRAALRLNDWGYALLVYKLAAALYPSSQENARVLFAWHLMTHAGLQVRVGYSGDRVVLLAATATNLYGLPYFTVSNRKYYAVALDGRSAGNPGALTTYDDGGQVSQGQKPLDLALRSFPLLGAAATKTYSFVYRGQTYQIEAKVNAGAVAFFRDYPQTAQGVYFNAASNPEGRALLLSLQSIVRGKSEREAVDILLRFVQTAFAYKTDEDQFGREKNMFPDETLHYPYSDCDDRAVFFAYLVRALLGLPVIGLDYPGHVATAVKFSTPQRGDAIRHQGADWLVCDPTYVNASPGMAMPQFKGAQAGVIAVR